MADTAALVYDIDSKSVRTAASDLAKLNDASARAAGGANSLNKTLRDSQGRFRSSYDVAKQYGDEIRGLAAKYNPALNAVYQYQNAQLELNRAVALGVLSQQQADAALERTAAQIRATATASTQMANAQKANGAQTANVFSQLNDIGVMLAAGQNPFQLALQQGTQLNQVWVSMGAQGRTLGGVFGMLKSAVGSMLSPMSLLTIGTIAGTAALVNWASSVLFAEKETDTFDDTISELGANISLLNSLNISHVDGISAAESAYGLLTAEVRELIEAQKEIAIDKINSDLLAIRETATSLTSLDWTSFITFAGRETQILSQVRKELELTEGQAIMMVDAMNRLNQASGAEDIAEAFAMVRHELTLAHGALADMPPEAKKLYEQLEKGEAKARAFAATDMAGGVIAAGNAALVLAQNMGIALATAQKLAALGDQGVSTDPSGKRYSGRGGDPREMGGSTFDLAVKEADAWIKLQEEIEKTRKKAGGGGGAAELAKAEKQFQSLRELLEKESIFQVAEYEKRQEQLQNALNKRLVTEQQYNELRTQLQVFYFGTEYERNALQYQMDLEQLNLVNEQKLLTEEQYLIRKKELNARYGDELMSVNNSVLAADLSRMADGFGQMSQLAGGGYDKLLKAQKIFAASSALVSTYQGAAKALELPFPENMIAMGKVLAAGMGLVNAIKGGGKGGGRGGGSSAASATAAAAKQEPTRYIEISVQGDSWAVGLVENVMDQIYEQTKNGRVIIGGAQ